MSNAKVLDGPIYWHPDRFVGGDIIPDASRMPGYKQLVQQNRLEPVQAITQDALYAMTATEAKDYISTVTQSAVLQNLQDWEQQHPQYDGGRKTVLTAITEARDDTH